MEQRNLDLGIEMLPEQWEQVGRRAAALGADGGGFGWSERRFGRIQAFLSDADRPDLWADFVGDEATYGATRRAAAEFLFNDGRPFARIVVDGYVEPPVLSEPEAEAMREEIERWTRAKWHQLLRGSGLHFERGHIPQS